MNKYEKQLKILNKINKNNKKGNETCSNSQHLRKRRIRRLTLL